MTKTIRVLQGISDLLTASGLIAIAIWGPWMWLRLVAAALLVGSYVVDQHLHRVNKELIALYQKSGGPFCG